MTLAGNLMRPLSPVGRWILAMEHAFERARASEKAVDDTRLRIFFVLALFGFGFLTLGLGATRAALFPRLHGGELAQPVPNARAEITDRNGAVLALDIPRYGLYVDPHEMVRKDLVRSSLLATLPGISPAKLDRILAGDRREFVIGALTPAQQTQVHDLGLPGVTFEPENGRAYPLDTLAAHLIGFSSKDGLGLAGVEKAFDPEIRAAAGKGLVPLSIDLRVQGALQDELEQTSQALGVADGVGMVVNVRTGEVLGMASFPGFNANAAATSDPRTMAMGIDSGVATPDTKFDVKTPLVLGSQTIHDYDHGDGVLTLSQVFTHSSNIGAARLGLLAGAPTMSRYFHDFGLFGAAPSELAESARPLTPKLLSPNIVASMSFGHAISVSPLAMATGMSAILDGGVYRPLTFHKLAPGQAPAAGRRVISEATSRTMLGLMRLNVTSGTGTKADALGLRVGGKTGTATKLVKGHYVEGKNAANLASFAAIFPTDAPIGADRYLVLIMLDEPKPVPADSGVTSGAYTAAPAAGRVIDRIAPFLGVRRIILPSDLGPKKAADPKLGADER
jgi:cell division protein FtsI (penicillin-binding protein 3)